MGVSIKRVYDKPDPADGFRVLVDRLWPRGVSKERADLDAWLKDVAPSPELRTWWGHNPDTMEEFARRYTAELGPREEVNTLRTILYGAKDPVVNHARILAEYLSS